MMEFVRPDIVTADASEHTIKHYERELDTLKFYQPPLVDSGVRVEF